MKLPIALQLYSVRRELMNDFEGTIAKISKLGYEGVEFAGLYEHRPVQIKEIINKYNLKAVSAHVPIPELMDDTEKCLAAYKEIGVEFVAIPWLDEARRPGHELYDRTLEDIRFIAEKAKDMGISLLYHNHDFEFAKINGEYALDLMYKTIPAELLKVELDTCWVNVAGEDPSEYIKKYADRIPVVHLKDFVMPGKKPSKLYELIGTESNDTEDDAVFEYRPLGSGVQDIPALIRACEEAGAKWLVVEQDETCPGKTSMECAELSIKYLKEIY